MKQSLNKMTYGQLNKNFEKTPKNTLKVSGYFTSDNKDEVGDIITRSATERAVPAYRQWGNIRLMHQPKPVAKVSKIGAEDGLEWNEVEIEVIDPEAIFMVENGLLAALSVGILVDFDNLEFLKDGGIVINDYQLAEISLVDHPANYDAKLKDLVLDQETRLFAMQYGFDALREQLGGTTVMKTRKKELTEEVLPEVVETESTQIEESVPESQVVTEEEVVIENALPVVEEIQETEEKLLETVIEAKSEEAVEEEVVEEKEEEIVPEAETEEVVESEEETAEEEKVISVDELLALVVEIKNSVNALSKRFEESANKGSVEEQKVTESEEHEKQLETLKSRNEELERKLAEYEESVPAERKGGVEETKIEELKAPVTETEKVTPVRDLKTALGEYFKNK